jgi:hypothetical protein
MSRVRPQHPTALVSPVDGAGGGPLLRLVVTSNGTGAVVGTPSEVEQGRSTGGRYEGKNPLRDRRL